MYGGDRPLHAVLRAVQEVPPCSPVKCGQTTAVHSHVVEMICDMPPLAFQTLLHDIS